MRREIVGFDQTSRGASKVWERFELTRRGHPYSHVGALAGLAVNLELAAVLFDYSPRHVQPDVGLVVLRGPGGLEDLVYQRLIRARAVVGNLDQELRPR